MNASIYKDDVENIIPKLFAILTARFEDGASAALDGQSSEASLVDQKLYANRARSIIEELAIIADVIAILVDHDIQDD